VNEARGETSGGADEHASRRGLGQPGLLLQKTGQLSPQLLARALESGRLLPLPVLPERNVHGGGDEPQEDGSEEQSP
jgi:hypothetical protein